MAKKKGAKRSQTLQVDTLLSPDLAGPVSPGVRRRGASTDNLDTSAVDTEDALSPPGEGTRSLRRTASSSSFNATPFHETFAENDGFNQTLVGEPENMPSQDEDGNNHNNHFHSDHHHHEDNHSDHSQGNKTHSSTHTHSHSHTHSQSSLHKRTQSKDIHNHHNHHHHSDHEDDEDVVADLKVAKKNREKRGHHRIHSLSHNLFPGSISHKSQGGPTEMHPASMPSFVEIVQNSSSTLKTRLIWGCIHFLVGGALWVKGQFGDSLCVTGFGYMVIFDSFGVLSHYISNVLMAYRELRTPSLRQPFGMRRYEVIVSFANTIYLLFAAMYMTKESLEHLMLEGADDHEDGDIEMTVPLFLVVCGLICTLVSAVGLRNHHQITKLLTKQSHYASVKSQRATNKSSSPLDVLLNSALALTSLSFGAAVIFIGSLSTHPALGTFDKAVAFIESFAMFYIGIPATTALAKILLQTTPESLQSQMDVVIREIQHNTSVLTVHGMHLWENTFGQTIATVQVHIRPEADEDAVLEDVRRRFEGVIGNNKGTSGEISVMIVKGL